MDSQRLEEEIIRISRLPAIEHEPAIDQLHKDCRNGGFPQRKPKLRELVKAQANAMQEIETRIALGDEVARLHQEYFLLNLGKLVFVGTFREEMHDGITKHRLRQLKRSEFLAWKSEAAATHQWLQDPNVRKFDELICDPDLPPEVGAKLNLWRGFGVEPCEGDAQPFVDYVTVILAQPTNWWCADSADVQLSCLKNWYLQLATVALVSEDMNGGCSGRRRVSGTKEEAVVQASNFCQDHSEDSDEP